MLMERLDDCLKVHADMLDSTNIGSIYELQDLAALHYYLKVEHEFTPAEVEALLSFQDPLEVARWCKEENTHAHSFPICELLNEIRAYERFEPALKQDESSQTFARFREALASDYFGFREQALSWSRERLFDAAGEIAALSDTFGALLSKYTPVKEEMPFFFMAMYERDGQPAEKILKNMIRHRLWPETRPYKTRNFYKIMSKKEEISIAKNQTAGSAGKAPAGKHPAGAKKPVRSKKGR